ncbi:MAG: winged helix-turn-helix transcriptional regulator [Chloroflexi bacterium]|nr:winged helix-turn-helix transcriptional regulator [Chloroflexota bacterium]
MDDANPESGSFEPAEQFVITTLETLKVFSDPLRQQILESLLDGAKTVKQIAAELDLAPTKLYYHINLLDEHQLIRVTETRIISGIIEKHYRATARNFDIRRSLLIPGQRDADDHLDEALNAILEPVRQDIHRGVAHGLIDMADDAPKHHKILLRRAFTRLSPAQAEQFFDRLEALIREFEALKGGTDSPGVEQYRLLVGLYPTKAQPITPPHNSNSNNSDDAR